MRVCATLEDALSIVEQPKDLVTHTLGWTRGHFPSGVVILLEPQELRQRDRITFRTKRACGLDECTWKGSRV
jgi:hypothetical protein